MVGCESTSELRLTPERVERARVRVLDQLPDLDSPSRDMIRTNAPKTAFVGLPFGGAYTFSWTISSNRVARLDVNNSLEHLESASVRIQE